MEFYELAKVRRSVRSYSDQKVEADKLEKILAVARFAPTAANRQPVRLIVLQEQEGLEKVSKAANTYHAPLVIIVCADRSKAWTRPYDGMRTTDIDASIITDHMMLEATDLGLGSVWICYFDPKIIRHEFDLPDELEPINILAIGYAADQPSAPDRHNTQRIPIEELVDCR